MTTQPPGDEPTPIPEHLREQVEHTRDDLGQALEPLADKADVKAGLHEQTTALKEQAAEKTAQLNHRLHDGAEQAVQLLKDKTPDPVLDLAASAAEHLHEAAARAGYLAVDQAPDSVRETAGRLAAQARARRTPLLAAAAVLALVLLVRRGRRHQ
ncbi:DUF3618 domain-containing protein [Kitasatospora sp. NPDC002040]|uniref:DUF3618 domain-containing protein n=1 Tax=Kitasatospora sp. NPDC002040 TaxID=3154661 RepID=UPI003327D85A